MLERLFEEVNRGTRVVGVPQRGKRRHSGYGDSLDEEQQRAVGAEALPHDGRPRGSEKPKPATAFETLTCARRSFPKMSLDLRERFFDGVEIW